MKTTLALGIFLITFTLLFSCKNDSSTLYVEIDDDDFFPSTSNRITFANRIIYPKLRHSYDEDLDTHDYSGNWDFDGDLRKDWLFLVGNGGAHLRYHPIIILSSKLHSNDYTAISIERPMFFDANKLPSNPNEISIMEFSVYDFNKDGYDDIYFQIDPLWFGNWSFESNKLILMYDTAKFDFKMCVLEHGKFKALKHDISE
jgi:hypothetical protein